MDFLNRSYRRSDPHRSQYGRRNHPRRDSPGKCAKVSTDAKLPPFYIGYAHEALARAAALGNDSEAARSYLEKAEKDLARVRNKEERELLAADLAELKKKKIPNKGE